MSTDLQNILEVKLHGNGVTSIIHTADILNLYFIEDIYSWCKCGKLSMYDNMGLWEFLPLVGDEWLTITYQTPVGTDDRGTAIDWEQKTYDFKIYKVSEITSLPGGATQLREKSTRYGLDIFFVEQEFFQLHYPTYSKTWIDMPYYDIIKEIFDVHVELSDFVLDEPSSTMCEFFSMNQKTPAQSILWLAERMKGDDTGTPGYMFFSNTKESDLSYNMCTMEKLLKDGEFLTDPEGDPPGVYFYGGGGGNQFALNKINSIRISSIDKTTIDFLAKRNYLGYDIYRKYMIKREFEMNESNDQFTCLGNYGLFNNDELKEIFPKATDVLTGESGDKYMDVKCLMENMYWGEWIKQYCLQQLVTIVVRGDVHRWAGGQIEIVWQSGSTDDRFNKQMLGRYLVKSITHNFSAYSKPFYNQKLVLIKNGYYDTDAELYVAAKPKMEKSEAEYPTIVEERAGSSESSEKKSFK